MSKKAKLLAKLKNEPRGFTWAEAVTLMGTCDFEVKSARGGGSGRTFRHKTTGQKVRLHEPHPQKTLLPYMVEVLIEGLKNAGEL